MNQAILSILSQKNHVMEIYGSVSFQLSISTYGSVTFQSSVKLVMEIYGSVSEAGELGLTKFACYVQLVACQFCACLMDRIDNALEIEKNSAKRHNLTTINFEEVKKKFDFSQLGKSMCHLQKIELYSGGFQSICGILRYRNS